MEHRVTDTLQRIHIFRDGTGLPLVDPLFYAADTGENVGIAEGKYRTVEHRPAIQQRCHALEIDHRPVVGDIEHLLPVLQAAVRLAHLNGHRLRVDIPPLAVIVILQGVVGVELQLVQAEAVG